MDLSGRTLPLFPATTANLRLNWKPLPCLTLIPAWQFTGGQYLDFTQESARSTDPYSLLNLTVRYQLPQHSLQRVTVALHLKNLLGNRPYQLLGNGIRSRGNSSLSCFDEFFSPVSGDIGDFSYLFSTSSA